jgi:hypothetical protein
MAKLGLKHIVASPLVETLEGNSYTNGLVLGEAMTANSSAPEYLEAILYGDDREVNRIKEFKQMTLSLGVTRLPLPAEAMLFGATVSNETIEYGAEDTYPYVGVGFYSRDIPEKDGEPFSYTAVILAKAKFSLPGEELQTKGDAINLVTPSIESAVVAPMAGPWRIKQTFATEPEAIEWIDTILNVPSESTGG